MKKALLLLLVVGFFVPSISYAACGTATPIGSTYHRIDGLGNDCGVRTNVRTLYYAWTYDSGNLYYPNNGTFSSNTWLLCYDYGGTIYWQMNGDFAIAGNIGCPIPQYGDEGIQIISYDADPATADNDVTFAVIGSDAWVARYDFDSITEGLLDGQGGNSIVPLQPIPQVVVGGCTGTAAPWTVELTWTEPLHTSYDTGAASEYMYGYRLYYQVLPWDQLSGLPPTVPTSNETGWTLLPAGNLVAAGAGGATIQLDGTVGPTINQVMFFALAVVGAGSEGATPFQTGFVGRSSLNALGPLPGSDPGAITLISFGADSINGKAHISWETGSEVNTAGYNLLRSDSMAGLKFKVNDALIPAQGSAGSGAAYQFVDNTVNAGNTYLYWLEEVENNSEKTTYGSVGVTIQAGKLVPKRGVPRN
ncbi:hypothetical protein JXQ70_16770 [bacterium]|nr:hypothetical protein [bacterium]